MLVFDIETGPQPESRLRDLLPPLDESQFAMADEFDESSVKLGNLKDPNKISEKIEAARKAWETKKADLAKMIEAARESHWQSFVEAAPLSAAYGRVLAIGLYLPEDDRFGIESIDRMTEAELLERFWSAAVNCIQKSRHIIGHNIHDFDLPFMVRRSWVLGVPVPGIIGGDFLSKWPKWNDRFVDTRRLWLLGTNPGNCKSNFDTLAAAFGTGGKTEDIGAQWWQVWEQDKSRALAYLEQDVRQPAAWARAMGLR